MKTKLTEEDKKIMREVRQEWLDGIFKGGFCFDKKAAIKGVQWLYKISKLDKPLVITVSNPYYMQIAANLFGRQEVEREVEREIRREVRQKIEQEVRQKIEQEVWQEVEREVRQEVWQEVRQEVLQEVEQEVGREVRQEVGREVRQKVWQEVRQEVGREIGRHKLKFFNFCYYGSIWDYGWEAFYDFFVRIKAIKTFSNFRQFVDLLRSGIYEQIQLKNICFICPLPYKILRERDKLHSATESAIAWKGFELYYLWGVCFPENLWRKIVEKKLSAKEILGIKNIEQRMAAMKFCKNDELLSALNATLVDDSGRNKLYRVDNHFARTTYFLRYVCPSTGRVYISAVDPDYASKHPKADDCMAWKFSVARIDYDNLVEA